MISISTYICMSMSVSMSIALFSAVAPSLHAINKL